MDNFNYTMLLDFYELTMANGYYEMGYLDKIVYFDLFFRRVPDGGGYVIAAGLEQIINYILSLKFTEKDISFLKAKGIFSDDFLKYLESFKFSGDLWAVKEGTPVFPNEPIITVRASVVEAQIIETFLLLMINHQSLIATKASRIVRAAEGRPILEMGSRRAHGVSAAVLGARAAFISGVVGTSCVLADLEYEVPSVGTMAHSWVQLFKTEYEAFAFYCKQYPENVTLLVDTFNVLKSGVPNAIKVIKEVLLPLGIKKASIRLDSGDLAYLSKEARKMFDDAGLNFVKIVASNSLDEFEITKLLGQGAKIDSFGVGERLITSKSDAVLGGVYKLVAIEENGSIIPKIKISENESKITNPHYKKVYRLFNRSNNKALADVLMVYDETIDDSKEYEIFDPDFTWKRKILDNFYKEELLIPIFQKGVLVYSLPSIDKIQKHCQYELSRLWEEVKRFEKPHEYYVDLSPKLWDIKYQMIKKITSTIK